jgi:hypothetical protein
VITRDDGVCFHVTGVGHMFAIPHDLAHLAVEAAGAAARVLGLSIFNSAFEKGHEADSPVLRGRLRKDRWTPPVEPAREISDAEIAAVYAVWQRMLALWKGLPIGETLELAWPEEPIA